MKMKNVGKAKRFSGLYIERAILKPLQRFWEDPKLLGSTQLSIS